jgi:sulfatase maturation enzyme AslB (radical SAM superfamily)
MHAADNQGFDYANNDLPSLRIRYEIDYWNCNLDCPYCIVKSGRPAGHSFDIEGFRTSLLRIKELPYNTCLHFGFKGEAFTSREILEEIKNLCNEENNLFGVSFLSNIQTDWDKVIGPFLGSVNTEKLGMGCTLHDSVITDIDGFFCKVKKISESGVKVYVTYVALPNVIPKIREYKERCEDIGVPLIMNSLIGKFGGVQGLDPEKIYPDSYTKEEKELLKTLWDTPHSYKLLVEACSPRGMSCAAGRNYIYIDPQGNVFPCNKMRERFMGNILKDKIEFQKNDSICACDRCLCGNQNQALRIVDRYYTRTRNIRIYHPRPDIPTERLHDGYNPTVKQ